MEAVLGTYPTHMNSGRESRRYVSPKQQQGGNNGRSSYEEMLKQKQRLNSQERRIAELEKIVAQLDKRLTQNSTVTVNSNKEALAEELKYSRPLNITTVDKSTLAQMDRYARNKRAIEGYTKTMQTYARSTQTVPPRPAVSTHMPSKSEMNLIKINPKKKEPLWERFKKAVRGFFGLPEKKTPKTNYATYAKNWDPQGKYAGNGSSTRANQYRKSMAVKTTQKPPANVKTQTNTKTTANTRTSTNKTNNRNYNFDRYI